MSTDSWDPGQYERFKAERARPFWDLVALIESAPIARAVDLGCGTGELTAAAAERLGVESMVGIDNSSSMLARAGDWTSDSVRFELGDIGEWSAPGDQDLVLANAALHWVPGHPAVLARWIAALRPGGQIAVQVPANADHPSHVVAAQVAATEPFLTALGSVPPPDPVARNVLAPEEYAVALHDLGADDQHVRLQVYGHRLASSADVVEWVRGTSLTRFTRLLPADLADGFVAAYRERLLAAIGEHTPYFYPFKRILMWARKPA